VNEIDDLLAAFAEHPADQIAAGDDARLRRRGPFAAIPLGHNREL